MPHLRRRTGTGTLARRHPVLHPPGRGPDAAPMSPSRSQVASILLAYSGIAAAARCTEDLDGRALGQFLVGAANADAVVLRRHIRLDPRLHVYSASWAATYLRRFANSRNVTCLAVSESLLGSLSRPAAAVQRHYRGLLPGYSGADHPFDIRPQHWVGEQYCFDLLTHVDTREKVGEDEFSNAGIAAAFALAADTDGFAGVRLICPRVPLRSRHWLTPATWHELGNCQLCRPQGRTA